MMFIEFKQKCKFNGKKGGLVILFSIDDYHERFDHDHNDPMVITTTIHDCAVKQILINQGSSVNMFDKLHVVV